MTGMRAWVLTTFSPLSVPSPSILLPDGGISNFLLCLRDSETSRATVTSTGDNALFGVSITAADFGGTMLSPGLGPRVLVLPFECAETILELLFGLVVLFFTRLLGTTGAACSLVARAANDWLGMSGSVTTRRGWGEDDRETGSSLNGAAVGDRNEYF
jgi:hypothetical protein